MIIETPRLLLRTIQDSDLESFVAYRSDPEVARYQSWDIPYPREQGKQFIEDMKKARLATPGQWYQFAIALKDSNFMIGDCAFYLAEDSKQAEIGYTLAGTYQGKGYATEAVDRLLEYLFDELKLHRVYANTDVENPGSIKLLGHLGLRREAHFIENVWFKGRWSSEYWYALLRKEWLKR
jgi:RimJ/RimL family protein N-acetyltransferase